eukprot:gnl/Hemi2/23770_TR7978_c0_g1_i1.p1 gnl/Hemi2/23770_TR7978_c0_g1~~gnl/Hemi2/23770_TR7978_c0_g1_i1.p1  ORF type:complete len:125 (+),score=23.17 gnl/Hemi2/23770_TR7978_c0_g1_i1:59-433(+)
MRLLTQNMLACNKPGCDEAKSFPLRIEASQIEIAQSDFNPEFIRHILPRIDWPALNLSAVQIGLAPLPETITEEMLQSEEVLRMIHRALLEVIVKEGQLVCNLCGKQYPISRGIPNMLLGESEM